MEELVEFVEKDFGRTFYSGNELVVLAKTGMLFSDQRSLLAEVILVDLT